MKKTDCLIDNATGERFSSQNGSVLIYIVAAILVAGVLGLGIVSMTTTSAFTQLGYNPSDQARFLAKSGMDYAKSSGDPDLERLILDDGEINFIFEPVGDPDQTHNYNITSIATVLKGTSREASFIVFEPDYAVGVPPGNGETEVDFPDDAESDLEDYWDDIGLSDAEYTTGGQSDGGSLVFKGETGLLGLAWGQIDGLDLKDIRDDAGGLLSYDLQVKTKIRPQGNNGAFYLLGLSFRLQTEGSSIFSGYGISLFRYTPGITNPNRRPAWLEMLDGFDSIKDGVPYLVLWKQENGGNMTLIDYADLLSGHSDSFISGGELNDWVTMAFKVEEKYQSPENGTENLITAYIQQPPAIEKGTKEWNYSEYIDANWVYNGIGAIIDDSLDSSGVDYVGDIEIDPPNYEYEIGVHAFYDGNPANQVFFADFGLKF